jgi:glycosyltransferase involved in cell wall biosynthesis
VLSFNQAQERWDAASIKLLGESADGLLIVDIYKNRLSLYLQQALVLLFRLCSGLRYQPNWFNRLFRNCNNWSRIPDFIKHGKFDAIIVNKAHTTFLVGVDNLASVSGLKILDMHDNQVRRSTLTRDVFFRLLWRFPITVTKIMRISDLADVFRWSGTGRMMAEQVSVFNQYDYVLFSSDEEAKVFHASGLLESHVVVMPWPYENASGQTKSVNGCRPYDIGFIASPCLFNFEALSFLIEQVLPLVRVFKPDLRVLIAGGICSQVRRISSTEPGLTLIPWVEHINDFYSSVETVVVPLLSGTGVSIKTLEAAWMSSAIVSTSTGMRGLYLENEEDFLLADDARSFADMLIRLLSDRELRETISNNAAKKIRLRHSSAAFSAAMRKLLGSVRVKTADVRNVLIKMNV